MAKDLDVTLAESRMKPRDSFFSFSSPLAPKLPKISMNQKDHPWWSFRWGVITHAWSRCCVWSTTPTPSPPQEYDYTQRIFTWDWKAQQFTPDLIGTWKIRPIFIPRHLKNTVPNFLISRPMSTSLSNYRVNSKTYNICSFLWDGKTDCFSSITHWNRLMYSHQELKLKGGSKHKYLKERFTKGWANRNFFMRHNGRG